MKKFNPVEVAGVVLIFVAFILLVVGTATGGWASYSSATFAGYFVSLSTSYSFGLSEYQGVPEGQATEAFAILSILASIGALGTMGTYLVFEQLDKMNDKLDKLPKVTHIITAIGGACAAIAIIIFAAKFYGGGAADPDYSWVLVIIGGLFLEAGGAVCHRADKFSKIAGSG